MPPIVDEDKCLGCGTCVDLCTEDVFFGTPGHGKTKGVKPRISHPEACYHCFLCIKECPSGAIRLITPMSMMVPYK
ncbi:MAG: ferredoxin family protein [Deltaproteobacteria bacterium]|nr:ferredoxin family protein [Deltaproteobacteria bacterium]